MSPLTLGTHVSVRLRRVTSLLQHWDSNRVVDETHFPFFVCHNEVIQLLPATLFVSERSYLNDSVGFPQGQRVWGSVIVIQKVEIQPWGGALVVQMHHQQQLSWLEPAATRFSKQQSPATCCSPAETMQAPGKEVPKSRVHFSKLPTPAKNLCH